MKIGTVLKSGARVLAYSQHGDRHIVLCLREDRDMPFATWRADPVGVAGLEAVPLFF